MYNNCIELKTIWQKDKIAHNVVDHGGEVIIMINLM